MLQHQNSRQRPTFPFHSSTLPNPTMGTTYDLSLGCLLVSSWANMVLFTLEPWGIAGYVIGTGITGAAVQIFLARMVFNLSDKQWIWLPILALFIMVGLAGAGATAATLIVSRAISSRQGLVKWVTVWLSGCVAADTFITIILVTKFQTLKTAFVGTSELLRRLSLAALRNGSITTTLTYVLGLSSGIVEKLKFNSIVTIALFKIQTGDKLCMLSNLNNRVWITNEASGAVDVTSVAFTEISPTGTEFNKTTCTSATVRIQQDIEYSTDDGNEQGVSMDPLGYGKRKPGDVEHGNVGGYFETTSR
ncbi:hypothetical protein B0H14DRAFT_2696447 [Mycena olivaceomarginata]|nr:hypothetical protein B0H14DRAFT_2696447 [Mycena olivaceomarginata]